MKYMRVYLLLSVLSLTAQPQPQNIFSQLTARSYGHLIDSDRIKKAVFSSASHNLDRLDAPVLPAHKTVKQFMFKIRDCFSHRSVTFTFNPAANLSEVDLFVQKVGQRLQDEFEHERTIFTKACPCKTDSDALKYEMFREMRIDLLRKLRQDTDFIQELPFNERCMVYFQIQELLKLINQ